MERKPRVHELARELGVPAKDVLAWLGKEQVFANSASSRVAVTIAARLRADTAHWGERRAANAKAAGSRFTRAGAKVGAREDGARSLTDTDKANIRQQFRRAYSSANSDQSAISALFRECVVQYGISRGAVREIVAKDRQTHPGEYVLRPGRGGGQPQAVTPPAAQSRDGAVQRGGAPAAPTPPPSAAAAGAGAGSAAAGPAPADAGRPARR